MAGYLQSNAPTSAMQVAEHPTKPVEYARGRAIIPRLPEDLSCLYYPPIIEDFLPRSRRLRKRHVDTCSRAYSLSYVHELYQTKVR